MRKINVRDVVFYVLLLTLLLWVVTSLSGVGSASRLAYSEAKSLFYRQDVVSFTVDGGGVMTMHLRTDHGYGTTATCRLPDLNLFWADLGEAIDQQWKSGAITGYHIDPPDQAPWWLNTALIAGGLTLALVLWYVTMARQAGLGGGGGGGGAAAHGLAGQIAGTQGQGQSPGQNQGRETFPVFHFMLQS